MVGDVSSTSSSILTTLRGQKRGGEETVGAVGGVLFLLWDIVVIYCISSDVTGVRLV